MNKYVIGLLAAHITLYKGLHERETKLKKIELLHIDLICIHISTAIYKSLSIGA